jgi:hypothetical protein
VGRSFSSPALLKAVYDAIPIEQGDMNGAFNFFYVGHYYTRMGHF